MNLNKVFLGIIAAALSIQAAPHLITAYKYLSEGIQERQEVAAKKRAANTRLANATSFCTPRVVESQQSQYHYAVTESWRDEYKKRARLATVDECISRFGRRGEYMSQWRKLEYPDE